MFKLENVDDLAIFKPSSETYKKIQDICEKFETYPTVRAFKKEDGDDRGVYYKGIITMHWSKPETPSSMFWVFLHEFKHYIMDVHYKLYREYFAADDLLLDIISKKQIEKLSMQKQLNLVHDLRPTEVLCNAFATEIVGKDYGISWYQKRKKQVERKRNVKSN